MAQRVGSPVPSTWKDFAERQGWVAAAIGDGPRQERDAAFEQIVTAIENLVAAGVEEASPNAVIQADLEDDHRWRFVSDLKLAWDPGLPVWQPWDLGVWAEQRGVYPEPAEMGGWQGRNCVTLAHLSVCSS